MRTPNQNSSLTPNAANSGKAGAFDWLLIALIVAIGGSAFVMIRASVATIPPIAIGVGRIWVGTLILYVLMRAAGRRLPSLLIDGEKGRQVHPHWWWMIAVGASGNTLPFFIFPWAQQFVPSALAGIYMAFMPIWAVLLGFLFADEKLGRAKILGFVLGFLGVVILLGETLFQGAFTSSLWGQLGLLFSTFLYGVSTVLSRAAPDIKPRVFATGMMIVASICAAPFLWLSPLKIDEWSLVSMLNVLGLGIFPTAINAVLIIMVIKRVGAGFMALSNYLSPAWSVLMGALIFNERLPETTFIALFVILAGVAISQRR